MFKKILEYLWLTVAVLSLAAGIHKTIRMGISESYMLFIMTAISLMMYLYRRNNRIRGEKL